jgi:hypothetical protein
MKQERNSRVRCSAWLGHVELETNMPATIIIKIADEDCAKSCLAAGAEDLATSFLPDAYIHASKVTVIYRTPEDERKALAGELDFKERRSQWPNDQAHLPAPAETVERTKDTL